MYKLADGYRALIGAGPGLRSAASADRAHLRLGGRFLDRVLSRLRCRHEQQVSHRCVLVRNSLMMQMRSVWFAAVDIVENARVRRQTRAVCRPFLTSLACSGAAFECPAIGLASTVSAYHRWWVFLCSFPDLDFVVCSARLLCYSVVNLSRDSPESSATIASLWVLR